MRMRTNILFLGGIAVLMLAVELGSLTFKHLETKMLPMMLAGTVFILTLLEIWREMKKMPRPPRADQGVKAASRSALRSYSVMGTWTMAFFLGIYLFGFIVAIPVFIAVYVKGQGRRWVPAVMTAGVTTFLIWGVFVYALNLQLYSGLFMH